MDQKRAASGTFQPFTVNWNDMNRSGTYVTAQGSLIRVPEEALAEQHSPRITIVTNDEAALTCISDNPYVPVGKARMLAADNDLPVNF